MLTVVLFFLQKVHDELVFEVREADLQEVINTDQYCTVPVMLLRSQTLGGGGRKYFKCFALVRLCLSFFLGGCLFPCLIIASGSGGCTGSGLYGACDASQSTPAGIAICIYEYLCRYSYLHICIFVYSFHFFSFVDAFSKYFC